MFVDHPVFKNQLAGNIQKAEKVNSRFRPDEAGTHEIPPTSCHISIVRRAKDYAENGDTTTTYEIGVPTIQRH
jgi:hypothetical protein